MEVKEKLNLLKEVLNEESDYYRQAIIQDRQNPVLYTVHHIAYLKLFLYTHGFTELDFKEFMSELLMDVDKVKQEGETIL